MKNLKNLIALLAFLPMSGAYGQVSFGYLGEKWEEYVERSADDWNSFSCRHFRDTVSVQEMKDAFFKYRDQRFDRSPYEGFDSVVNVGILGNNIMLVSPLRNHPMKEVRECRGVWGAWGHKLVELRDRNGVPQKRLLEKLNADEKRTWLDGEVLKLGHPLHYMGFVVSPRVEWHVYDKGEQVACKRFSFKAEPDFFSYASRKPMFDGNWDSKIDAGARLLGAWHAMQSSAHPGGGEERTFSVLLYEVPGVRRSRKSSYTVELLGPENPDKETTALFEDFRKFVESIPSKAFKPYYTTALRTMTGRYYRVTVNKCGWLVEDYLYINK